MARIPLAVWSVLAGLTTGFVGNMFFHGQAYVRFGSWLRRHGLQDRSAALAVGRGLVITIFSWMASGVQPGGRNGLTPRCDAHPGW